MTDRILTEEEAEKLAESFWDTPPRYEGDAEQFNTLYASHRLLQKRVTTLEITVGWYEAKHPND